MSHSHRPSTGLKQSNKVHRGNLSSRSQKDQAKGRIQRKPHIKTAAANVAQSKAARRNQAKQIQQNKRRALVADNRASSSPRVVVCLSLTDDVDPEKTARQLFGHDLESTGAIASLRLTHPRPAQLQVLMPPLSNLYECLDVCAAADYVLLLLSPSIEIGAAGDTLLRSLCALGVAENGVRGIICGDAEPTADIRRSLLSFTQHFFGPSVARLYAAGEEGEVSNLLRSLCDAAPKEVRWREERSRMLVEAGEWRNGGRELRLTGTLRGSPMSANQLVHLPGIGDVQVDKIVAAPFSRAEKGKGKMETKVEDEEVILSSRVEESADDLRSTNSVDPYDELQNEQTWPTEEELAGAPARNGVKGEQIPDAIEGTTPRLKKVPKGTSHYQATWIVEDDESEEDEEDFMLSDDGINADGMSRSSGIEDEDGLEMLDTSVSPAKTSNGRTVSFADHEDDAAADEQDGRRWRAARDEERFPDEMDTPMHIPARERFARYRGLRSLRTSPWDAYENLPGDYAKIYMFRDWRAVGRSLARQEADDEASVQPGTRVTLVMTLAEERARGEKETLPTVAWALHKHEHKRSVAHCTVLRNSECDDDVRSKDPLVLQIGPRRYHVSPLYSQHTQANAGKGSNNVHKFERFLPKNQGGMPSMATMYLPVTFGTTLPSLFFRDDENADQPTLIGSGILHSCDPTRVIAKRIVLTGHPVKVHKRTATIRYLFFNPEDVAYFKPVQLRTKRGRVGYIKESLGTHGLLKAGFDGPVQQQDTVCLALYKRVFPKWSTLGFSTTGSQSESLAMEIEKPAAF